MKLQIKSIYPTSKEGMLKMNLDFYKSITYYMIKKLFIYYKEVQTKSKLQQICQLNNKSNTINNLIDN
jgi:hypothetical protein